MSDSTPIEDQIRSDAGVPGSRARKEAQRTANRNPVREAREKVVGAGASNRRDKVDGGPKSPSPLEGRKGDIPPSNPSDRERPARGLVEPFWPDLAVGENFVLGED